MKTIWTKPELRSQILKRLRNSEETLIYHPRSPVGLEVLEMEKANLVETHIHVVAKGQDERLDYVTLKQA
jgi:hypothetical protein